MLLRLYLKINKRKTQRTRLATLNIPERILPPPKNLPANNSVTTLYPSLSNPFYRLLFSQCFLQFL